MHADPHEDSLVEVDVHTADTPTHTDPSDTQQSPKDEKMSAKSLISFALIVLAIVVPIRLFIAKPFIVEGTSMYPTFNTLNYLIVDQISYRFTSPQRGDVITFRFPQNPSQFLIKRIIGLPNETVRLADTAVTIINTQYPDGFTLDEPYVKPENELGSDMTIHLGDNEYFVMGDNRKVSADSRYWGPLEYNRIVGRAFIRLFPFNQIGTFPGAASYAVTHNQDL